ncbi:hypothetical protein HC891_17375 [Candidatus Gracilibacteria bacterium]|nr:hypothetical protein [Candidatus Gracilibacteria bacterium]
MAKHATLWLVLVITGAAFLGLLSVTGRSAALNEAESAAVYLPIVSYPYPTLSSIPVSPTTEPLATATVDPAQPTATAESTAPSATAATPTRTLTPDETATSSVPEATTTPPVPTSTMPIDTGGPLREGFEDDSDRWQVGRDVAGGGSITRSAVQFVSGEYAAQLTTSNSGARAALFASYNDAAANHQWQERPGTFVWQRAAVFVPAATLAGLGAQEYIDIGGMWASSAGTGWFLRVRQNGELFAVGQRDFDDKTIEFRLYGRFPTERWVDLELGLHSQAGPGVKRAFAFLLDGDFYGWYHQGRMKDETYDRAGIGIVRTNHNDSLEIFVDQWRDLGTTALPTGSDKRATANLQEQDYRTQSGVQWQIDWTTWENDLRLHPQYGLYSASSRLQSGRNLDRMPDLTNGWAEIEIDWPQGTPDTRPSSYFGPMVGFRKEINREENLEIIPIGKGDGKVALAFEAWVGSPLILAEWPLPAAAIGGGSHIPEPGDIIRARWQQINATTLNVRASYYDASSDTWYNDIINWSGTITALSANGNTVNYTDGYHTASSVTIDSPQYAIRRFKVGTLETYPGEESGVRSQESGAPGRPAAAAA